MKFKLITLRGLEQGSRTRGDDDFDVLMIILSAARLGKTLAQPPPWEAGTDRRRRATIIDSIRSMVKGNQSRSVSRGIRKAYGGSESISL